MAENGSAMLRLEELVDPSAIAAFQVTIASGVVKSLPPE